MGAAEEILKTLSDNTNPTLQEALNSDHGSEAGFVEKSIAGIPLHIAVFNNDAAMVALLLQYGADPSFFAEDDYYQRNALDIALTTLRIDTHRLEDKIRIIDLLCLHGALLSEYALEHQEETFIETLAYSSAAIIDFSRKILERVLFEEAFLRHPLLQWIHQQTRTH